MKKIYLLLSLCVAFLASTTQAMAGIGDAIDKTNWTIAVSSACDDSGYGQGSYLIDGNVASFWHSNWGNGTTVGVANGGMPQYFQIDLGSSQELGGVGIQVATGRNNKNGTMRGYKVFVSETPFTDVDGFVIPATTSDELSSSVTAVETAGYEVLASATTDTNFGADEVKIAFSSAQTGRYILFVFTAGVGNFASAGEFWAYSYASEARAALLAEIAKYSDAVNSTADEQDENNPGYYNTTAVAALTSAVATAQAVAASSVSDEEYTAATTALANAAAAAGDIINGLKNGAVYRIVSAYKAFYTQQSVYKTMYANGTAAGWHTQDNASATDYWTAEVGTGTIYLKNYGTNTYLAGTSLSETAANVSLTTLAVGEYNIVVGGVTCHANGHGSGAGTGSNIVNWSGAANTASAWRFEYVENVDAILNAATFEELATLKTTSLETLNGYTAADGLFQYNAEKIEAAKALCNAAVPATYEEAVAALAELKAAMTTTALVNLPENGDYIFINKGKTTTTLVPTSDKYIYQSTTQSSRAIFTLTALENGKYTLQNKLTGLYLTPKDAFNSIWTVGDDATEVTIYPADNALGYATVGLGNSASYKMHADGWGHIVSWSSGDNTSWQFVAVTDELAETLATAEATLLASELSALTEAAEPLATLLDLDMTFNTDGLTFKDIVNGTADFTTQVYEAAGNNYYYITNKARAKELTIDGNGLPAGADAANIASHAWKLVSVESGIKLMNANTETYISAVSGGTPAPAATMTTKDNGGLFTIGISDADAGEFRFYGPSLGTNAINMEDAGYANGDYILDSWNGTYSIFTIAKVESVDITLTEVSGKGNYATAYLPFAVEVPADVKAYVGTSEENGALTVEETSTVAAKNGMILEGEYATAYTFPLASSGSTSTIGGTLVEKDAEGELIFTLGATSKQLGFFAPASGTKLAANKAYYEANKLEAIRIVFPGGDATGINAIEAADAANGAATFDLQGRRVANAQKGVYIQNGKKFIVK